MHAKTVIGIDVGGTKISVGRVSENKKVVERLQFLTESKKGGEQVIKKIIDAAAKLQTPAVTAIGVGIAGIVDYEKGLFIGGPNLPKNLKNTPLASVLKKRFRLPTAIDNDVHCFTLAEAKLGSAKRFSHVVGLTFGTGVGGGIVLDGQLYRGRNNAAGEFGHTTISKEGAARCGCGKKGHFEAYASGTAMTAFYFSLSGRSLAPSQIEERAANADRKAKRVLAVTTDAIAMGLANIIYALNPEAIVVGGGLANLKSLWGPVRTKTRELILSPLLRNTPIVHASLGADAGILGAALLAEKK